MTHSRTGSRNRLVYWLSTLVFTVLWPVAAIAQAMPKADFDIPPQLLETALQQVAQVQRVQILFSENDVKGLETSGVKGKLSTYEAVQKLIEGTGLSAVANQNNAIAIKPRPPNEKGGQAANPTVLAQAQSAERPGTSPSRDQTTSSDQKAVQVESIMVTAQKREERLLDVPSSIAVVTKEEIDRRGLVNGEDYLRGIPGTNQLDTGYGGPSIVIRGMETSLEGQNNFSGASVATYFGETPTTSTAGLSGTTNIDLKLVDIERVEVLRGPQGTAFGSSSMGGAVRIIPVAPRLDRFEGKAAAGYSVTSGTGGDNYMGEAILNMPLLEEKVAIRAVGYQFEDSGFYRNRAGSNAAFRAAVVDQYGVQAFAFDQEEVGAYYVRGGRIATLFQATNDLRFTLNYLSQRTETEGIPLARSGRYEQTVLQVAPEHVNRGRKTGHYDSEIDIANAMMEYDWTWANLLATYSYTKSGSSRTIPYTYNLDWPASQFANSDHDEHVGEIRLGTRLGGPWNFLAGVYVEKLEDEVVFHDVWYADPATNFLNPGVRLLGIYRAGADLQQKAAFGEASWDFVPRFTLTGGVRAYNYKRVGRTTTTGFYYGDTSTNAETEASGSNFRANLSYKLDDRGLLYAGWSQGFRLGKPQPGVPPGRCDRDGDGIVDGTNLTIESTKRVNSDTVDNYELGGKFELLDRRLTLQAAIFRMKWSDIPIFQTAGSTTETGCGINYVANAGAAVSEGVEFQARYQVTNAFRVDFGGSLLDARLTGDVRAQGFSSGGRLPGSPKANANLSLQYEFNIRGYKAFLRADSIYVSSFYSDIQQTPSGKAGGYVKLDASARMSIRNLNVDLFLRNLTNEDAFTFRSAGVPGEFGARLRPRTIGLRVGYTF